MKKIHRGIFVPLFQISEDIYKYAFLLFLTFFTFSILHANAYSQESMLSISAENITVKEVLKIIENDSKFRFFYSDNFQDLNKKITVNLNSKSIDQVMSAILEDCSVTYEILENNVIVITPNESEEQVVKGRITDMATGEPLPGVNVMIKGTTEGTVSNMNGEYVIILPSNEAQLIFSFVGYITEEVTIQGNSVFDMALAPSIESLEEVVVVGYGIQKKVNLTGSVSSITSEEITQRPVPNSANLLQGRMAGVNIIQGTGQPGKEDADILIHGLGSYGSNSKPLILVDGVVGELEFINPQDIESVSVLKDAASAAIYGARAANGVILVTTKKGKAEPIKITYGNNFAIHKATRLPELIWNSAETMEMWNEAAKHSSNAIRFTTEEIEAYREGHETDPLQYPNYNWIDNTFKRGFAQNHHIGISGGSERITFNTSLSLVDQDGILPGHSAKRYTVNLNMNTRVHEKINLGTSLMLSQRNINEPSFSNDSYVLMIFAQTGLQMPYLPDGSGRYTARAYSKLWQNRNPIAVANEWKHKITYYDIRPQVNLDVNLFDGLVWKSKAAVNYEPTYEKLHTYGIDAYYYQPINGEYRYANNQWPNSKGVTDEYYYSNLYTFYSTLQYQNTFGNHNVNVLGGYSQENRDYHYLMAYRQEFPTTTLSEIDAGSKETDDNSGNAEEWALQSLFGRVNYSYKDRYLTEANFRYDGTSRIAKKYRWGFFPSFSAAWRLSNENFFKNISWIDNLKLRVSYGELGNQDIGTYPYQDVLETTSYTFDDATEQGVYVTALKDESLIWEVTRVFDAGIDYSMKRGLFSFVFDAYRKFTDGILYKQEVPAGVGLDAPTVNYGSMENVGIDLELGHRHQLGDFKWEFTGILSAYRNKCLKLVATEYKENNTRIQQEGLPWMSFYLYEWIGIFQSEEEIENSPQQLYSPQPGDLKFKDQNEDGLVNSEDKVVVDGAHPDFTYSLNGRFEWKNFDLTVFLQGVQGRKLYVINWGISPFTQAGAPAVKWRNAWSEDNPTNELPALYIEGYEPNTNMRSTFNLQDASYLRIKNINLGYTIPKEICNKLKLDYLRVYVSADNLFTFTDYEGLDPERSDDNTNFAQYPQVRILSAGLNVRF